MHRPDVAVTTFATRLRDIRRERGLLIRELAREVPCSHVHIIHMEKGKKAPSPAMAARLDTVLGAGGDLVAALTGPRLPATPTSWFTPAEAYAIAGFDGVEVDRLFLNRLIGAAWFGMLPPELAGGSASGPSTMTAVPARLEHQHVAALRSSTGMFEQWDHQHGGGLVRAAMGGQFEWACRVAREASMTNDLRQAWQSAAARLGDLVGWASFDAGEDGVARRYFLAALQLAGEAGDLQQRTHTATSMIRQMTYLGATDAAKDCIDLARVGWRHLPPLGRSVINVVEARTYGRTGERQECLRAVGACDDHFAAGTPTTSDDTTWSYYADEGQVLGDAGHALYDLAMATGDQTRVSATIERLKAAYVTHPPEATRSKALTMIRVACLEARFGDPDQACAAAESGVADASQVASRRVADDLMVLDLSLGKIAANSRVGDQVGRIRLDLKQLTKSG